MVFYRNTHNSRGGNIIEDVPALCFYLSSSLYISHKRPAIIGPDISLPIYQKIWDKIFCENWQNSVKQRITPHFLTTRPSNYYEFTTIRHWHR